MRGTERAQIHEYIDCLIHAGYLRLTGDQYPVLRMTEQAKRVLFEGEKVLYAWRRQSLLGQAPTPPKERKAAQADDLFAALKTLRGKLAQAQNVPAYIVFTNAALADMAARQPQNMAEFMQVTGVGEVKAARYGQAFLETIHIWRQGAGH